MSRIGKAPVSIPNEVDVTFENGIITVKGPKGILTKSINPLVVINLVDNLITFEPANNSKQARAMYGTFRSIVANMVKGVVTFFSKELVINGVGFKAVVKGRVVELNLGYSHLINYELPEGVNITVKDNTKITLEGPDKHLVGQAAADIKQFYPVEPYKQKGVTIVGEFVRKKEGKKSA